MKFRAQVRHKEALAVQADVDIMDLLALAPQDNEQVPGACVVHIRGPLEQRPCGFGDDYESIIGRFQTALASDAPCVVLRIDSPGGVVAGLNQAVFKMQRAKAAAKKPVYVYVDELVASAAYALACGVGDDITIPPSGVAGSVGVVSVMADQVNADKKAGLNYVTITSGARKADGHPHAPISEAAIAAETERVEELAEQFFAIVDKSRRIDSKALQAGIFTGADAVEIGIADQVAGWDDLLAQIALAHGGTSVSALPELAQPGTTATAPSPHGESTMLKLKALLADARKALKAATTEAKRKALKADIGAYTRSLASLEAAYKKTTKTETKEEKTDDEEEASDGGDGGDGGDGDDGGKDGEDGEDGEDGDKKDEPSTDESAESDDEDASAEDEEPKKDAKKAGKAAALADKASAHDALQAKVARLEAQERDRRKASAIATALGKHFITKPQAKMLGSKKSAFVTEYLSMHKTKLFLAEGEELSPREGAGFATTGDFSESQMAQFRAAARASGGRVTVEQLVENYRKNPIATNGVAGAR